MKRLITNQFGFSLIEILVVVTIIGLIAAVSTVSYSQFIRSSRDAKRKADLTQIAAALEIYKSTNNVYPSTGGGWRGACSGYGGYADTGSTGYVPDLAPTYINKLPHDPKESKPGGGGVPGCSNPGQNCYLYRSDVGGASYKLLAHCTPETTISTQDSFYDPVRAAHAYQVSSNGTAYTTW